MKLTQPLPVGSRAKDISLYGCRDMAGNCREWTRDVFPDRGTFPPAM